MHSERNSQRLTPEELSFLRDPSFCATNAEWRMQSQSSTTIRLSDLEIVVSKDSLNVRLYTGSNVVIGEVGFVSQAPEKLSSVRNTVLDTYGQLLDVDPLKGHGALSEAIVYAHSHGVKVSSSVSGIVEEISSLLGDRLIKTISKKSMLGAFEAREIVDGVLLIRLPSQYLLGATFIRFQELYESPQFAGRLFSLKEYQAWYRTTTIHGGFSYYSDWAGFNVPDHIFATFKARRFAPSKLESILLEYVGNRTKPFYVIGAVANSDFWGYAQHELAHALYYLDSEYRHDVDTLLSELETGQFEDALLMSGYAESKLRDEMQAYLLEGPQTIRESYDCSTRGFVTTSRAIKKRFIRALNERLSIS